MRLYIIAGEDSGDLHASNLMKALKSHLPDAEFRGVGGDKMLAAGADLVAHVRDTNFMGFVEVVKNLGKIRKLFKTVKRDIQDWKPEAVILLDYPGFNIRIAGFTHTLGIQTFYYISPQVWAWKKGRVHKLKRTTDRMFVILPFEKAFYANEGMEVDFVGHPLLDVIQKPDPGKRALTDEAPSTIALLPGSRRQEVKRMLPPLLELTSQFPDSRFIVAGAPSLPESFYRSLIDNPQVELRMNDTYDVLEGADYAVVTSGTATLETALFGVPQVVVYKGGGLSFLIGKMLVDVKYISLVNLIMDRPTVTELIQQSFTVENVATELRSLMWQSLKRDKMLADYTELWNRLGNSGAAQRTASLLVGRLKSSDE